MSTTMHEQCAEMMLDQMLDDPDGPETLALATQGIRDARWGQDFIDAIGQHGRLPAGRWPMEQVAAFTKVHALIYSGEVAQVAVGTSGEASPDAEREENAATLATLPRPFTAAVNMQQRLSPRGDGLVRWDEPIWVETFTGLINRCPDGSTAPYLLRFLIPPGTAPLEIGSSLPSKTWEHLVAGRGAVARWPYGYSAFRLFINLGPSMAERMAALIPRKKSSAALP